MKVGIMQPYFFPYIGYFQLIAHTDKFVFFDIVQYNKRSWMNRNRILHQDKPDDFQYITVPVSKHEKGSLIKDIRVSNDGKWQNKILSQLMVYKKLKAPFYNEIRQLVEKLMSDDSHTLLDLSIGSTRYVCDYLDIAFNYEIASEMNLDMKNVSDPGDWALEISKYKKASEYVNPPGGQSIFDEDKFVKNNIKLSFLEPKLSPYKQSWRDKFNAGLSVLDVIMFNTPEECRRLISHDFIMVNANK